MAASKKKKMKLWVCFWAYLLFLTYLLFFSDARSGVGEGSYRYNLTLFQEIGRYWGYGLRTGKWLLFIVNVIGNVAFFVPIGALLPRLSRRCKNVWFTLLLCIEGSLLIEIVQLVARVGSFDVDDLLLNTLGGVLGWSLFLLWDTHKKKMRKNGSQSTSHKRNSSAKSNIGNTAGKKKANKR